LQGLTAIREKYENLFGAKNKRPVKGDSKGNEKSKETVFSRWGWMSTIYNLTDGDITKEDAYYKMTVVEFYNRLAMIKDIQDEHKERMKMLEQHYGKR
jgi:hypothetical protein